MDGGKRLSRWVEEQTQAEATFVIDGEHSCLQACPFLFSFCLLFIYLKEYKYIHLKLNQEEATNIMRKRKGKPNTVQFCHTAVL